MEELFLWTVIHLNICRVIKEWIFCDTSRLLFMGFGSFVWCEGWYFRVKGVKYFTWSQFTKTIFPWTFKVELYLNFKNCGISFVQPSANPYQQTRSGRHINISKHHIMIYLHLSSHRIPIQSQPQQKKTIRNSQEHFKFTFSKMQPFILLQYQNHMSNSLPTWVLTTYFNFLFL